MDSFIKSIKKITTLSHVERCKKCNNTCYAIHFQRNFKNWTSSNDNIDKFIQNTQLLAHDNIEEALEWIPYDRLYDIKYIAKDELGEMYRANWIDGNICYWDDKNKNWERGGHNAFIVLKSLSTSNNFISGFINKV
uniref:Uncharacterized protein n=1 Tax=Rhizophagus irregularis (strain DAOM 181602 / DAOM 197198 / MUCL 43194) TaxID=747089 RepID=U9URA8_RHIID